MWFSDRYSWLCSGSFLVFSVLWWPQGPPIYEQEWEGLHHILSYPAGRTPSYFWADSRFCSKQSTFLMILIQNDSWFLSQASSRRQSLPMKAMLKSLPVWAIVLNTFAFIWSNSLLVTYTPTFINTVLHVNIREVSVLIFKFMKDFLFLSLCLVTIDSVFVCFLH